LYIAPTNIILNQFVDTLVDIYFGKDKSKAKKIKSMSLDDEINYLEKYLGTKLHLYTYAKIHRMTTDEMEKINATHIVLDEFHRCGANKWGKSIQEFLRINSKAKVMGLSATPIRPSDGKNMVEEMFDGKIASELTLVDALEQNILPLPIMINAIYSFEDEIVSLESRLFNKKYDPEKQKEIDKTLKEIKQLIGQSGGVKSIFAEHIEELTRNKGRQDIKMVVFCKDIADRDRKMDECKLWFPKGTKIKRYSITSKESEKNIDIQTDNLDFEESAKSKKLRQKVIETFEQDNSKGIKLLFVVDMLNEGFRVKNLDGVIMLRDTSSNIIFLQQLGRALSVDNDRTSQPLIFDLVNNIEVLGNDIEEYKEIIHRLTKNKGYQLHPQHQHDFEIQGKIINIIQYLKDISYTFDDRIAPLVAYYNEFGTISNILAGNTGTKYEFNGETYNLGSLIHNLRREYSLGKLSSDKIDKLNNIGMVWTKFGLADGNIRPCIKEFIEKYLTFVEDINKHPTSKIDFGDNINLYQLWLRYRLSYNLKSEEEKQYLIASGIKVIEKIKSTDNIRPCIKEFVSRYLEFVSKYGRTPKATGTIDGEYSLYQLWLRYTISFNLKSEEEKQYLIAHGLKIREKEKSTDNIRPCIKEFVENYLSFIKIYNKHPQSKGSIEGEKALYLLWFTYSNPKNLKNEEEKQYIMKYINRHKFDNVRLEVKDFVENYLSFIKTYGKHPQASGSFKDEHSLYTSWIRYTNPKNLKSEEEKQYLIDNGFELRVVKHRKMKQINSTNNEENEEFEQNQTISD